MQITSIIENCHCWATWPLTPDTEALIRIRYCHQIFQLLMKTFFYFKNLKFVLTYM